jgi:hypothetical protein
MLIKTKSIIIVLFVFLFICSTECCADSSGNRKCDSSDLQRCDSCIALKNTINLEKPDEGEYYRGAYWNGLYAAYKLNCLQVAKDLLDHHANPNLGGSSGSFLASIVSAWPHDDLEINKQWAEMLIDYPIDIYWKNPYTGQSAKEIISNELITVDYPEILNMLMHNSKKEKGKK